jgi:hypothetical protein
MNCPPKKEVPFILPYWPATSDNKFFYKYDMRNTKEFPGPPSALTKILTNFPDPVKPFSSSIPSQSTICAATQNQKPIF